LGISQHDKAKHVFETENIKNTLSKREGKQLQESNLIKQTFVDVGF
jgi:hypothetical protein